MKTLQDLNITLWDESISTETQNLAIESLESGKVIYLPQLNFTLLPDEKKFLSPDLVDPKRKNISYDLQKDLLGGTLAAGNEKEQLKEMLRRYALNASSFMKRLFPHYAESLIQSKTSFRPTEIFGRKSSVRKDDTRLHVDAFPSNPTKGRRILRLFTNINCENKPRVWRVGESFEEVVKKFACKVPMRLPASAYFLQLLKITKDSRSAYDHYMLHMHNKMKADNGYQQSVNQEEIQFPAGSSWIVFTDQVSHAALSGQHVLEQTFSLPVDALHESTTSPLKVLESFLHQVLV